MENRIIYLIAALTVVVTVVISIVVRMKRRVMTGREPDPYTASLKALIDGDSAKAFALLQEAVRKGGCPADAYLRLGRLLRERGEANKALQIHQSLTIKTNLSNEERVDLFLDLAEDYDRLGKPDRAIRVLESSLGGSSRRSPRVYSALASYYFKTSAFDKAYEVAREMKKAGILDDRKIAFYLAAMAENLCANDKPKEASRLVQRALKHDPDCPSALLLAGDLDLADGEVDAALEKWRRAALASSEIADNALERLEKNLFERGRFNDIERVYKDIMAIRPADETVVLALARFYRKQGKLKEAADILKEHLSWHPEASACTLLLLSIQAQEDDMDEIRSTIKDIRERSSFSSVYACKKCGFNSDVMRWYCPLCNAFESFQAKHEA